ncbi:hypothetical protein E2C01_089367 [Portunus trituberculatus]|uniref:Uncharacterized protein n=1 Tax=Portunus trituberculatus TaxID=210409 RepID=A0A5B7J8M2_PORTR|nr:hypothetical protein [Portunus trituberculatus]
MFPELILTRHRYSHVAAVLNDPSSNTATPKLSYVFTPSAGKGRVPSVERTSNFIGVSYGPLLVKDCGLS